MPTALDRPNSDFPYAVEPIPELDDAEREMLLEIGTWLRRWPARNPVMLDRLATAATIVDRLADAPGS